MAVSTSLRTLLLFAVLSCLSLVSAADTKQEQQRRDIETFEKLLDVVPQEALHEALHDSLPNYKHGVFREDRAALEAVHHDDAATATSLIVKGLLKRQTGGNGTTTSSSSTTSTTSTSSTPSSTSTSSTPTSTFAAPTTTSTSSTFSTSSTSSSSSTSSTTTSSSSSSTSTKPRNTSRSTQTMLRTSTLSNGQQSTVTAVTVVAAPSDTAAPTPSGEAGVQGNGTPAPSPGLQTGAAAASARPAQGMLEAIIGGLVAAAMGVAVI